MLTAASEIWLARHGESLGNVDASEGDTELSARGRAEALVLGEQLRSVVFDEVWSSPLKRALETAALAVPGVAPRVDTRLTEFTGGPSAAFVDTSALDAAALMALLERGRAAPRSESGKEFMGRVRAWLDALPRGGRVIAFTHFGVVREILGACLGFQHAPQAIPHACVYRIDCTSDIVCAARWP